MKLIRLWLFTWRYHRAIKRWERKYGKSNPSY